MSARDWILYCAALLLISVIFSFPLALYLSDCLPYSFMPVAGSEIAHQYPGDYLQLYYRFWLFTQAALGRISFFSNPYEFSTPVTPPFFTTQGIPISFFFLLFYPLGGLASYNILILLSFVAAGVSLSLLVHELTGSRAGALICGALYACLPYRLGHLYGGHSGGFVFFLVPLTIYCLEKAWRYAPGGERSAGNRFLWGMGAGACILCSSLTELHITFYSGILALFFVAVKIVEYALRERPMQALRRAIPPLSGMAITSGCAFAYSLWVKYSILETSMMRGGRTLASLAAYNPSWRDLFWKNPHAEKNIYLGLIPVIGAIFGIVSRRREIRRGKAGDGALIWFYFWVCAFVFWYFIALGTALEPYIRAYSWMHRNLPFLTYTRTSGRALYAAAPILFILCGYCVKRLLSLGGFARICVFALAILAFLDYHPKRPIGLSIMGGMSPVYEKAREDREGKRLLELPIWPGDSAWSCIYEYYVTLSGIPIINGYNPAAQLSYIGRVFDALRNLNIGEMRTGEYRLLREWDVRYAVLHQNLFPRKVSRYPFRFTLLNLLNSPYLQFIRQDGPNYLFRIREEPSGPPPRFNLTSPVGNIYESDRMKSEVGSLMPDHRALSGVSLHAGGPSISPGRLARTIPFFYPTGRFRVYFRIRSIPSSGHDPVARLEVCTTGREGIISSREVSPRDFQGSHEYRMFELDFENDEPRRVGFHVHSTGRGALWIDFVYVLFKGETDPGASYEAEDLFHIGYCVKDALASNGLAVQIGKTEDLFMPMVNGPNRLYAPGRYLATFILKGDDAEEGVVATLLAVSSSGEIAGKRDVPSAELSRDGLYVKCPISFTLNKLSPLSFQLLHYNRARLRLDRIEMKELP